MSKTEASDIKKIVEEIASISQTVPEQFRLKCFEILLQHKLQGAMTPSGATKTAEEKSVPSKDSSDLFSRFCDIQKITKNMLERVFDFSGEEPRIIVGDLKKSDKAGRQRNIALLIGVKNLYKTSQTIIPREEFVAYCRDYSAYDTSNFSTNMKSARELFIEHQDPKGWRLTKPGEEEAARVIKELATGSE